MPELIAAEEAVDEGKLITPTMSGRYNLRVPLIVGIDYRDPFTSLSPQPHILDKSIRSDLNVIWPDFERKNADQAYLDLRKPKPSQSMYKELLSSHRCCLPHDRVWSSPVELSDCRTLLVEQALRRNVLQSAKSGVYGTLRILMYKSTTPPTSPPAHVKFLRWSLPNPLSLVLASTFNVRRACLLHGMKQLV